MKSAPGELIVFTASAPSRASRDAAFAVVSDLSTHLEWAGERAPTKTFRLLTLDAPRGAAPVGTRFASTGANTNGTFHDESVVTECAPYVFSFETSSRLDRKHGKEWRVGFTHRYEVERDGDGSRIDYTCRVHDGSYLPYWLQPRMRRMTKSMVQHLMTKHLRLLAQYAEDQSQAGSRAITG